MPEFNLEGKSGKKSPSFKGKKEKHKKAQINDHERELAKKVGGKRRPMSGALDHLKGDVAIGESYGEHSFLLDSKETEFASIIVTGKDLAKISREAFAESRNPGLIINIEQIPFSVEDTWALIPLSVFTAMLDSKETEDATGPEQT